MGGEGREIMSIDCERSEDGSFCRDVLCRECSIEFQENINRPWRENAETGVLEPTCPPYYRDCPGCRRKINGFAVNISANDLAVRLGMILNIYMFTLIISFNARESRKNP